MASKRAIAAALAMLAEARPREITTRTIAVYFAALEDLSDEQLEHATARAVRELKFFPAPAELRDFAGANVTPFVDADVQLARLEALGSYHPASGWRAPSVDHVRQVLGDAMAEAYSLGGAARLFAGNETTRDIARREFAQELRLLVKERGLAAVVAPLALPAPSEAVVLYTERTRSSGPRSIAAIPSPLVP